MSKKQKLTLLRIMISSVLWAALMLFPPEGWLRPVCFLVPYLLCGYDILWGAIHGILHGQLFDENFLMAVATVGAFSLGEYGEAVAVMIFDQAGQLFESVAVARSRKSIAALTDLRPDTARVVLPDGSGEERDPYDVPVGSLIEVRPGERIPIDSVVYKGTALIDTSALTGESVPVQVCEGESVLSGSVCTDAVLILETEREFDRSAVMRILELVEEAASRRSRSESFITRFARIYTPAVCAGALALALLGPAVSLLLGRAAGWSAWIYRALTFLVISCPCALVISIPLGFFAGIGGAGSIGILIKGSSFLETCAKVKHVVLDKTGTITEGMFEVTRIHHSPLEDRRLLELVAYAESASSHPAARSILRTYGDPIDPSRVSDITEIAGRGVSALVDGMRVRVGNRALMESIGITCPECDCTGTVFYVAGDDRYLGHIQITDRIRPEAAEAVKCLKELGVNHIVMLSGDRKDAAEQAARRIGIDTVYAQLLPQQKVEHMERLLKDRLPGEAVAFVGDGINDAPVLTRADLGFAMGAIGSDAAIEAADVVLTDDDPRKVATAIALSRRCMRIIRENIGLALGIKAVCLVLGALGIAGMWLAIFADVGVMVLCVLNAIRALRTKAFA